MINILIVVMYELFEVRIGIFVGGFFIYLIDSVFWFSYGELKCYMFVGQSILLVFGLGMILQIVYSLNSGIIGSYFYGVDLCFLFIDIYFYWIGGLGCK